MSTANAHEFPSVATDASGGFIAVWYTSNTSGLRPDVLARRYSASGDPVGSQFRVNTYTEDDQLDPDVAVAGDGVAVVVWVSDQGPGGLPGEGQDGDGSGIYGRRFSASGAPLSPEFRVNSTTAGDQEAPSVAADAAGTFVVAWTSADDNLGGVYAQRYGGDGAPVGSEFRVNTRTANQQGRPAVAMLGDGSFIVVWESEFQDGSGFGVYARRYDAAGVASGPESRVNTYTSLSQGDPAVAANAAGEYAIAWTSQGQEDNGGGGGGVYAQLFSAAGTARGDEIAVNTTTEGGQGDPSVAIDADGDAVVVWSGVGNQSAGIYARTFTAEGAAAGDEFRVDTPAVGFPVYPTLAATPAGDIVVAWSRQGPSSQGLLNVFAQRYRGGAVTSEPGAPSALILSVRPNPVSAGGPAQVLLPEGGPVRLSVHDVLGREVYAHGSNGSPSARTTELDTTGWQAGVYVVRVEASGRVASARLVVVR